MPKDSRHHQCHVPVEINSVSFEENDRTSTGIAELDRVLGGGIVAGSLSACRRRSWNRKVNTYCFRCVITCQTDRQRCTVYFRRRVT